MKRALALALTGLLGTTSLAAADGAALIIGNGDYDNTHDAVTAERDAEAVSEAFEELGWDVTKGFDLDRDGMRTALSEFSDAILEADEIVIYYSGHAIRSGGITYLAPVDAEAETLIDVLFDGVPFDHVLQLAAEKAGRAVVFIDGAQLRGFTPTDFAEPGLDQLEGPDGVLIVSAAEPGHAIRRSRWRDSRFARLIIDQFLQPGASVMQTAEEAEDPTFVAGSVEGDFMLAPAPEPVAQSEGLEAQIELAYWRTAERSGDVKDYQAYLERYPNGTFSKFARQRLGIKDPEAEMPKEPEIDPNILAERELNLSRIRKRQIQEWLLVLGYNPRGIDGLFGRGSRNAIAAWQKVNGFERTTYLTAEQVERLSVDGEAALAEQRRIAEEQRKIRDAEDNAYWSQTGAKSTPEGYRTYLEEYPEGLHSRLARAALAKIAEAQADAAARREHGVFKQAKSADTAKAYRDYLGVYPEGIYRDQALARLDEIEGEERRAAQIKKYRKIERALELTKQDRASIEQRLRYLGFETGEIDGNFGKSTRSAIKGYQSSRGLTDTGFLNQETVVTLVRETNQPQPQQGQVRIDGAEVIKGLLDALGAGQKGTEQ
jgi:peptidoglycan hydrolase-like protein with peptidoglycan-binding domain